MDFHSVVNAGQCAKIDIMHTIEGMCAALNSLFFLASRMVYLTAHYKQVQIKMVHVLPASGQAEVSCE